MPSSLANFGAGPAKIPYEVLAQIKEELFNWDNTGLSVMEVGHRTKVFGELVDKMTALVRKLLNVPSHFAILFLPGGAQIQFAMTAMNLSRGYQCANYLETGHWSNRALIEAEKYTQVHRVASGDAHNFLSIPARETWNINPSGAYLHYTDNETINGLEFPEIPQVDNMPLVSDMSSNILSRPLDFSKIGCVYACAQKNMGIAGVTLVIVRDDLLDRALPNTPEVYHYKAQAKNNSLYATPPSFAFYVSYLVLSWLEAQGGISRMVEWSRQKSQLLYQAIDNSTLYKNSVDKRYRSRMNIPFRIRDEETEKAFLALAAKEGLVNLDGHRSVGGVRASLYNAVTVDEVSRLVAFMDKFAKDLGV